MPLNTEGACLCQSTSGSMAAILCDSTVVAVVAAVVVVRAREQYREPFFLMIISYTYNTY